MLMQIGSVQFTIAPLNTHEYTRETASDFASKSVVGTRQPLEFTGVGEEVMKVSGKLFLRRLGGLNDFAVIDRMQQSGSPQLVMRGDGKVLGWFVIIAVSESSTYLDRSGVGQVIDIEISLKRADPPTPVAFAIALFAVF